MKYLPDNSTSSGALQRSPSRAAIVLFGVMVLGTAAASAWFIRTTATPATAQGGARMAATTPDRELLPTLAQRPRPGDTVGPSTLTIDRMIVDGARPTLVDGRSPPLAAVMLMVAGRMVGNVKAEADGTWAMVIDRALGFGDHRLQLRATPAGGGTVMVSDAMRLSVPSGLTAPLLVQFPATADADDKSVSRPAVGLAEAMAAAGDEITVLADSRRNFRVAQAQPVPPAGGSGPLDVIRDWLQKSDRTYQDIGIKGVSASPDGATGKPTAIKQPEPAKAPAPRPATPAAPAPVQQSASGGSIVDSMTDWFKRANDSYQATIGRGLSDPPVGVLVAGAPKTDEEPKKAIAPPPVEPPKAADPQVADDARAKAREQLRAAQAQRDAELKAAEAKKKDEEVAAAVAKAPAPAVVQPADDAIARKTAEDKRLADEALKRQADLKAADERRQAELRIAEQKKAADEAAAARQAEAKRQADQQAAQEAASRATAQQAQAQAEAERRQAEQRAAQEAAAQAAARAAAQQQADAKRLADERAAAQAQQRAAQAARPAPVSPVPASDLTVLPPLPSVSTRPGPPPVGADKPASPPGAASGRSVVADLPPLPSVSTRSPAPSAQPAPSAGTERRTAPRAPVPDRAARSSLGLTQVPRSTTSAACRTAGRRINPPGHYVVQDGDTLWDIADKHYNDGLKVDVLERANPKLNDVDLIRPCQRVYVPALRRN